VYLARDWRHERRVALKVLNADPTSEVGELRFIREIRLLARLQHPNILPLLDSGHIEALLYYLMPYVSGETLRARMSKERQLSVDAAVSIAREAADALSYAHTEGVIHRDIKPENILLSGGHAIVADFGIARAIDLGGVRQLTRTGMGGPGTPAYMSPEQLMGDHPLDGRSDVYSLGCVLYEMLVGKPPFAGKEGFVKRFTETAPRPSAARKDLPEWLDVVVAKALARDPSDRYRVAEDLVRALSDTTKVEPTSRVPAAERGKAVRENKTVFVMDFTNISNAADIDWLSTGIAETVSVDLKKVAGINVVGSDPAVRQRVAAIRRDGPIDAESARELGQTVGAHWVVWGGFQKSGSRLRLTPQFAETESGEIISADKIDGDIEDIFALQDRIVTRLADVLRIKLTREELKRIERPETSKLTAYELYAKGKQAFQLWGKESARIASEYFRQAIEIDPDYALAWAGLGSLVMPRYTASGLSEDLEQGVRDIQKAIELDPSMGEPYGYLAYTYSRQHRFDESIVAARIAVDHDPGGQMSWYLLGTLLAMRGLQVGRPVDLQRAIPPLLRSRAISASFHPAQMVAGAVYILRGEYGHASVLIDEAVAIERSRIGLIFFGSYVQRAAIHINLGELDAGKPLLDLAIKSYTGADHAYAETMAAYAHFIRGCLDERRADDAAAEVSFRASCELADTHDRRLGIGAHWVKSKFGLARTAHRRGDKASSAAALEEAMRMFRERPRFVWSWIMGCAPGEILYECAAAHAVRGEAEGCISALREAADFGWADLNQLNHDPAMVAVREREDIRQFLMEASARATLPPPVGAGGLPDMT
jgi:serine/threonine-protein kinase